MRRFRFVGDPENYKDLVKTGEVYGSEMKLGDFQLIDLVRKWPKEWEEVFEVEPKKSLHQTDLGYYSGLFLQGLISANQYPDVEMCIKKAKELIKKLKEECQGNQ